MAPLADIFLRVALDNSQISAQAATAGRAAGDQMVKQMNASLKKLAVNVIGLASIEQTIKRVIDQASKLESTTMRVRQAALNAGIAWGMVEPALRKVQEAGAKAGFSATEVTNVYGVLVTRSQNVTEATQHLNEAFDLARVKNYSLADAASAVHRMHLGNVRALKDLGVVISPASSAMERQAKVAQALGRVHGQAEAFTHTFAGRQAELRAEVDNAAASIGTHLLPALSTSIGALVDHGQAIANVGVPLAAMIVGWRTAGRLVTGIPAMYRGAQASMATFAGTITRTNAARLQEATVNAVATSTEQKATIAAAERALVSAKEAGNIQLVNEATAQLAIENAVLARTEQMVAINAQAAAVGMNAATFGVGKVIQIALTVAAAGAAAWGLYEMASQDASDSTADLVGELSQLGDAWEKTGSLSSEATQAAIKNSKTLQELARDANKYGVALGDVAKASAGDQEVQGRILDSLGQRKSVLEKENARLYSEGLDLTSKFGEIGDLLGIGIDDKAKEANDKAREANADRIRSIDKLKGSLKDEFENMKVLHDVQQQSILDDYASGDALQEASAQAAIFTGGLKQLKDNFTAMRASAAGSAEVVDMFYENIQKPGIDAYNAQLDFNESLLSFAEDQTKANTEVADSYNGLADAQASAAESITSAQESMAQAVADANTEAAKSIAEAIKKSDDDVARAQKTVLDAEAALTKAREDATKAIADQRRELADLTDTETQHSIELQKARTLVAQTEGLDEKNIHRREALLALSQAQHALDDDAAKKADLRASIAAGVAGAPGVIDAASKLTEARAGLTQAGAAGADAVATARAEAAAKIAKAQSEGSTAVAKAQKQGADEIAKAQDQLAKSAQKTGMATEGASRSLDENTVAGIKNVKSIEAQMDANRKQLAADIVKAGNDKDATNRLYAEYSKRNDIILDNATKLGFNRDQVQAIIDKYNEIGNAPNVQKIIDTLYTSTDLDKANDDVNKYFANIMKWYDSLHMPHGPAPVANYGPVFGPYALPVAPAGPVFGPYAPDTTYQKGLVKFAAAGGPIYGPGGPTSDVIPALLSAGEHIWSAAEVDAVGGHGAMVAMRARALGHALAGGGTITPATATLTTNTPVGPTSAVMTPDELRQSLRTWTEHVDALAQAWADLFTTPVDHWLTKTVNDEFTGLTRIVSPAWAGEVDAWRKEFTDNFATPIKTFFETTLVDVLSVRLPAMLADAWLAVRIAGNDGINAMIGLVNDLFHKINAVTVAFPSIKPLADLPPNAPIKRAGGGPVPGHSPNKHADNIPIWATAREFMQPVDSVDFYGQKFMEDVRLRRFPRRLAAASYAHGGSIDEIIAAADSSGIAHRVSSISYDTPEAFHADDGLYHSKHKAVDFGNQPYGQVANDQLAAWFLDHYGSSLLELIHTAADGTHGWYIGNGKVVSGPGYYGDQVPLHIDHVHVAANPGFTHGNVGPALGASFGALSAALTADMLTPLAKPVQEQLGRSTLGQVVSGSVDQIIAGMVATATAATGGFDATAAGAAQEYAKTQLAKYGWGADQFGPLKKLWDQESDWNPNAVNPSSGAYGIPQALGHGHPFNLGDYVTQINWGLDYIKQRYGFPGAAWAHEQANNWYDAGGWLQPGPLNRTGKPEAVLTPQESAGLKAAVSGGTVEVRLDRHSIAAIVQGLHTQPGQWVYQGDVVAKKIVRPAVASMLALPGVRR